MERTRRTVAEADLVLKLTAADEPSANSSVPVEAPVIRVLTKSDLGDAACLAESRAAGMVVTSCLNQEGISELWSAIDVAVSNFGLAEAVSRGIVLNERHRHRLAGCHGDLSRLAADYDHGAPGPGQDVTGTLLFAILAQLGEISGRVFTEQLLENIFKRFCVGK